MPKNLIYKNLALEDEEKIIKTARQSPLILLSSLIMPIGLIILPFFLLYPLFSWGDRGIVIFSIMLGLGLVWLVRTIVVWYWQTLIITSQRIIDIDQKGLFQKIVSNVPMPKIQDVFFQIKGVGRTIAMIGDIHIILTDNKTKIEIKNISHPQKIQQLILALKMEALKEKSDSTQLSAQELVIMIKKIKAGIGEEKFNKILENQEDINIEEI